MGKQFIDLLRAAMERLQSILGHIWKRQTLPPAEPRDTWTDQG